NLGVFNDDTPYHADCSPDTVQTTDLHLSALLKKAHRTWRSYQEDTDVDRSAVEPQLRVHHRRQLLQLHHAVQLRGQAQSDGVFHRHQRRVQRHRLEPAAHAVRAAAAAGPRSAER